MKRTLKTYSLSIVLGIIGIVVGVAAWLGATYNWESHEEFTMTFPINIAAKLSSYYNIDGDLELLVVQSEGTSTCKYSIYSKQRYSSSYDAVVSGITFDENDYFDGDTYPINTTSFQDTMFKGKKTVGTNISSKLSLSVGIEGE